MPTRFGFASALAVTALLAGPALAQQTRAPAPPPPAAGQQQLGKQDMNFVKEAAMGGMTEVELGKLAESHASDNQVRQFGQRMVRDHGAAGDELTKIASGKGMTLPKELDGKHAQLRDRMDKLRGGEFGRAYMRDMVKDHDKDLKAFRHQAQVGTDPDIKQFAAKTATIVEDHDRMAHEINGSLTTVGSSRRPR